MKYTLSFILTTHFVLAALAQIEFESGYFIDNNENRFECLIKNKQWSINPEVFEYRNEQGEILTGSVENTKEFAVGSWKYRRVVVDIELPKKSSSLTYDKDFEFSRDTIFVRALVEGEASLYSYSTSQSKIFLFQIGDFEVTQLAYKQYLLVDYTIAKNNRYKTQIQGHLQHPKIPISEIEKLSYKENVLIKYFSRYNSFFGESITLKKTNEKGRFFYSIKAGAFHSNLSTANNLFLTNLESDFQPISNGRIGIEIEYNLPVKKNKLSLIQEITYSSQSTNGQIVGVVGITQDNINYGVITVNNAANYTYEYIQMSLPAAIRYYSFLSEKSKLFYNAGAYLNIPTSSEITYDNQYLAGHKIKPMFIYKFGIGFLYKNKIGLDFTSELGQSRVNGYPDYNPNDTQHWVVKNHTISAMVIYRLN